MFVFNIPPTAKFIQRLDHDLPIQQTLWTRKIEHIDLGTGALSRKDPCADPEKNYQRGSSFDVVFLVVEGREDLNTTICRP